MIKKMTATVALGISTLGTLGNSESAKFVFDHRWSIREELRKPEFYFYIFKQALPELAEIAKETSQSGWDGYNAQPVQEGTLRYAYAFLESMPNNIHAPSIGAEPDGHVTFEWHKSSRRTLSISVSPTGELHYAALFGPNKTYGTEIFYDEIPNNIVELIDRVYST
jgi:hypothetical protein